MFAQTSVLDIKGYDPESPKAIEVASSSNQLAAEEQLEYDSIPQFEKAIVAIKKKMEKAARDLDFMEAAKLRDEMFSLQKKLEALKTT